MNKLAILYSKFIGLHLKESHGIELNKEDFLGVDLRGSSVPETLLQLAYSNKCTTSPDGMFAMGQDLFNTLEKTKK